MFDAHGEMAGLQLFQQIVEAARDGFGQEQPIATEAIGLAQPGFGGKLLEDELTPLGLQ